MTGMEEVLAAHESGVYVWDYGQKGINLSICACDDRSQGARDPFKLHAAHVAQALAVAGFGSQHDAWAEGYRAGLTRLTIPNPYPITEGAS